VTEFTPGNTPDKVNTKKEIYSNCKLVYWRFSSLLIFSSQTLSTFELEIFPFLKLNVCYIFSSKKLILFFWRHFLAYWVSCFFLDVTLFVREYSF
jgi:hypothetical protein